MTWLFIRFYLCVLVVLALAWYIHGAVLKSRAEAEWERVVVEAHGGGARLVARELDAPSPQSREQVLTSLRERFNYPVNIIALMDLPKSLQSQFSGGDDVACLRAGKKLSVVAALTGGVDVVCLGPFPNYDLREVEDAIGGWMRLAADRLYAVSSSERTAVLEELQPQFDFPLDVVDCEDLPDWPQSRIAHGDDVVFYSPESGPGGFAVTPLSDGDQAICFGPFPGFERIEQKAATTTLGLVLLPAALAIALLLRPVAGQLHRVENTAKAIAAGDLSARVDERRVRSAKPLAQAFNNMAGRTETLIRTQRELLQAVSHELRTPLSRMRFSIELIEIAKDDNQRKRRLEELDAATEELDELVGELLTYVRMETLEPRLKVEPISIQDMFDVLIPKYVDLHPEVHFELSEAIRRDEDDILVERIGFQRALGNLLSNAGRHARSQVTVSVDYGSQSITVNIDDDGKGVPESDRERVFEPFQRLDEGTNGGGVGLGLALVKRIVTRHGGKVEVLTSPLGGCRIRTTWPIGNVEAGRP